MDAKVFMGYPANPPALSESLRRVAKNAPRSYDVTSWESLEIGGQVVIRRVLEQIDNSDFCLFDITYPNKNVLFEAGYAVARAKPLWLTLDSTVASAKRSWDKLALLKPIGYTPYRNSDDLIGTLRKADFPDSVTPIYDSLIEPILPDVVERTALLYCPPYAPYEAANRLTKAVEDSRRRGLQVVLADPAESSLNEITWYAPKLASSAGVLINFAGERRNRSEPHNSRNSFLAGMAVGFEVPLLMLAEDDFTRPFDYEDRLEIYQAAARCLQLARPWLGSLQIDTARLSVQRSVPRSILTGMRLGEHVAENELSDLGDYFIETAAYNDVVMARDTLFVGHRGTGKTANALQAFDKVSASKDNVAVLIKPAGFEFPGLLAVFEALPEYTHEYLFDTLWKFLIQTEICAAVLGRIRQRPSYLPRDHDEDAFEAYLGALPFDVNADIAVRLDQALGYLTSHLPTDLNVQSGRVLINEAFHADALAELRHRMGPVLKGRKRVAVFIDNLDKGWKRNAQLDILAKLILGLLTARGRLLVDFGKQDWWRDEIKLTVAIFLRSDIFTHVKREAREPDKLSISTISWRDPETLISVLEERVVGTWTNPGNPPALWGGVFEAEVDGTPTKDFITNLVVPRPRDLVFLCNAAISRAVDRRHDIVTAADIKSAVETYSQYAYEALLVENGITIPEMESVLFAFLGSKEIVSRGELVAYMADTSLPTSKFEDVATRLVEMSFLGIEVGKGAFIYPEVGSDLNRALMLAKKLEPIANLRRYRVHPAFHSFLSIDAV